MNKVYISRKALDVSCREVQRVIRNQEYGIGPPLNPDVSADVVKQAVPGADVVVSFIGFEVFVAVVQLDVASSRGFVRLAVVFDVVGAKTSVRVMNVHLAVSCRDIAFAALRLRLEIGDSTFGGRKASLLRRCHAWRRGCE